MRQKHFQIVSLLLLTASVILASCGKSHSDAVPPAKSLAMKGTSGNAVNMNGTWSGCLFDAGALENERDSTALNGGSATFTASVWAAAANANCTQTTTPDILIKATATATLASDPTTTAIWIDGSGVVSTTPSGISATAKATKATIVFNTATVTLGSDAYVADANSGSACGYTNWVKGVAKNVLTCISMFPSTTETEYWVVNDSAAQLKWYSGTNGIPWQVDNFDPLLK
jgi:hypothetical protein